MTNATLQALSKIPSDRATKENSMNAPIVTPAQARRRFCVESLNASRMRLGIARNLTVLGARDATNRMLLEDGVEHVIVNAQTGSRHHYLGTIHKGETFTVAILGD